MLGYALVDGQPYCTPAGAIAHARRRGWASPGGAMLSLDAVMRKLARAHRAAVLVEDDGSVTTYTAHGGKVRQRIAERNTDEARWLVGRFQAAAATGDAR